MKRIMILSDYPSPENPADYTFIKSRVEVLSKRYEIVVVSLKFVKQITNNLDIVYDKGQKIIWLNIKLSNLRVLSRYIHDLRVSKLLESVITDEKPDLIHVHFSVYYSWIIEKLARERRIPYFITEHASYFEKSLKHYYLGERVLTALNNAEEVIAVSNPLIKVIHQYLSKDIKFIPNFVDTDKFCLVKREAKEIKIIQMVTIGTLYKNDIKGYEILIKALYLLKQRDYKFLITIIGDGPHRGKLESMVTEFQLTNEVKFVGIVENQLLIDYFAKANFFISSSRKETFGVAIIEAMSCGLPVVATRSGGPEDYMNEHLGILVEKESIDSLLVGMIEMIENSAGYDSNKIREFIVNNYSKEAYLEMKEPLYNRYL